MTVSVITGLTQNIDETVLGFMPFDVELRGKREPRVKVHKLQDYKTGALSVRIDVVAASGKPVVALSTLDAIARRVLDGAKIEKTVKGALKHIRHYAR